ncbi:hypothetical protein KR222_009557, partial [Zaprionus bogoriensis]
NEDDEALRLVDDDAAEIARLQLPAQRDNVLATEVEEENDERVARIEFHCKSCDMRELVHYFGREPPFALGVKFREESFVMRDPFQAPPPRWQSKPEFYIALGAKCAICAKDVCKDAACSFYYTKTFCLPCGKDELKSWPVEAQARLRKQLAAKDSK